MIVSIGIFSSAEIIGGYTADYLDYGVGARYLAMGGVGRTIATDANAGYWNPALLPQVHDISLSGMTTTLMGMTKYNQMAISIPLNENDAVAATYVGLNVDNMELHGIGYEATTTPEGYFTTQKNALMLSYGHRMNQNFNVGVTAKYGSRSVYKSQDSVFAVDAGSYINLGAVQVGGTVRNLFAVKLGDQTDDNYDLDFDLGASAQMDAFLFSLDVARIMRKNTSFYVGAEYSAISIKDSFDLKFRGGINSNEFSLGLGIQTTPIFFDYAFLVRPLSQEHLFSMGINLENTPIKRNTAEGEKWSQKALDAIDRNEYSTAKQYIRAGLVDDPTNEKLLALDEQLGLLLEIVGNRFIKEENGQRLLFESMHLYLNGDFDKSVEIAEYLSKKNSAMQVHRYKILLEEATQHVSKFKDKDIVQTNFELSEKALQSNNVEGSIDALKNVIYFEPKNFDALKQLGDNFFMLNETDLAIEAWERAHQVRPDDQEVFDLLKMHPIRTSDISQIMGLSIQESEKIMAFLSNNGILNSGGYVTSKFKPLDANFKLGLPDDFARVETELIAIMQKAKEGANL